MTDETGTTPRTSPTPRVSIRPTGSGDLPGLAALFEERFGHPWTEEEWTWKYRTLPGEARSWVAVVDDEGSPDRGRVVAHAGALRLEARLSGADGPGRPDAGAGIWQLTDWMGSVQGGGLRPPLVTLGRRLLADLPAPGDAPWIFGFPSERHLLLGRRAFGYRPLPPVQPLAGELAEGSAAGPGVEDGPEDPIREVGDRCGDWAEAAWSACGVPSVRRSPAFLNWRYHARPGRYYRAYRLAPAGGSATVDAGPDGLAVFAFVANLARGAELWLPSASGTGAQDQAGRWAPALRAVARDLLAAGLERWQLWPPPVSHGLAPLLESLGLRPSGDPVIMGCRGRGGTTAGPSPADPDFFYSMGDYDSV